MGFLPARMSRLLVGGHHQHLEKAIRTLHAEGAVHLEDYHDPTGTTRIGTPLPAGEKASELLVAVRGLQKAIGSEDHPAVLEHIPDPARTLGEAQEATSAVLQTVERLRAQIAALDAERDGLAPLSGLELDLAVARGLASVRVFAGTAREDPSAKVQASGLAHELQVVPSGRAFAVALAVAAKDQGAAERLLAEHGFSATTAASAGTPAARLAAIALERADAAARLAGGEEQLAALRTTWGTRLAGMERILSEEVERTQAPLMFGVTEQTFHVEGWVPRGRVARVEKALKAACGDSLYIENLGDAPLAHAPSAAHPAHAAHAAAGHAAGHGAEKPHGDEHSAAAHDDPKAEPPVHLENPPIARPYEFLLTLLGKPRYQEIDPTKLMLFFFPLFFGLMVGDVAVGLIIMLVGHLLKTRYLFGIGGPAVGRALFAGGLMSVVVGLLVFGEALGIHFVAPEPGEMSWASVLHIGIPYADQPHGLLFQTGHAPLAGEPAAHEGTGGLGGSLGALLAPKSDNHLSVGGWFNLGYYSKVHDILALLVWSVLIGLVHIVFGLVLGVRNFAVRHGVKLAIQERAAWLGLMASVGIAAAGGLGGSKVLLVAGIGLLVACLVLLWMGAQHTFGKSLGFIALMEVPTLLGNLLSYTRLAAIGASKAGMAIALNVIGFQLAGGGVVGWAIYVIGFAGIIPLAILAGGLQSLRLQFVEFFQKFYEGGGRPYVPFGRQPA